MWRPRSLSPLPFDDPWNDRPRDPYFPHGMNHQPPDHDTYDQRYQGHLLHYKRSNEPLDVQNRYSKWDRYDYNHVREFQRSDSRQTGDFRQQSNADYRSQRWDDVDRDGRSFYRRSECELNEARGYNKYKPFRGRGCYRGEDRDQRDRSRGHNWNKMQAKRPSDIEIERHEKKRRLMEGCSFQDGRNRNIEENLPSNDAVISVISNFLEKRDRSHEGKHRSSSRERFADDSRRSSSREGSQNRSSKDRKIVKSSKSDSDKSHSSHSSKDSRKRHDSKAHSSTERQVTESDTSISTDKIVEHAKLNSAIELPKQKLEEEKKKEKALCKNVTMPANSTMCTSVSKSVSVDKVSISNTKSFSKGSQDKSNLKSAFKHRNVVHIKPKIPLHTVVSESSCVSSVNKLADPALKSVSASSASSSSNSVPKKVLPKIPKIQSNSGGSKNATINETKKLSTKHHRHSLGGVPLQPSKPSISSGSSVDGKQLNKKKHRHSSGHVSQCSPKKNTVVTSKTVPEVTNIEMDHDASSERDEPLPHLVHRKRHSRISGSKSPPQSNVTEQTVGASGLFHVEEKGLCEKEDVKKASKTTCEESHRLDKTTHGKENIVTSNVSKNLSKPVAKDHDKHRSRVKSLNKKTVSNSKEQEKHNTSVKPADKEKVLDAAKKGSNLEKHCKSVEALEGKKSKLTGSLQKGGTGKDFSSNKSHHKNPGDLNMDPVVSLKKLPNKTALKVPEKTKTVESIPIENAVVESSASVTHCADRDAVSNCERMSLFDLFKDSSEDQPRHKHSKLSLKRTPDKLRKGKPTSSTKSNVEQTKSHHNKRKIEDKLNGNFGKKAKLPHDEEVSSTELGNACSEALLNVCESSVESDKPKTICDTTNSEAEKLVSTSVSNHSTLETDISSSGVSEKDMHNESELSVNSSGRHMDESGSGCTSFSLSSCMSSPSFNKSDTMLSDNCSEMETTCNTPELVSGQLNGEIGQSLKTKNSECDSSKGMPPLDLYDSDDDEEGGRLVIDFNPCSVTSLAGTGTEKNLTQKRGENQEVRDSIRVTGGLETPECFQPVEDIEIPSEMRESCLDRTNQMDETIPYNLDDTQNSSVDQHQATALPSSETSTPDLLLKSSSKTPPIEEMVPYSLVTSEDSSLDQPLVSCRNASEVKEEMLYGQDAKKEGSEDQKQTDTITQSDTTRQDLHLVSSEQTTHMNVTVPSSLDTTEGHSVNQIHSDTLPKSDITPKGLPVNDDPEAIDTNESQQMNNDKHTFKFPRTNQQKPNQKHSDGNITPTDDFVSSQDEMMDVSLSDFDDKDDIRLIMYNGGDIESPWTPMPATPYISYSQEDDTQEEESLPEEDRVSSSVSEGLEIIPDQEKTLILDQEKDMSKDQESDSSSHVVQLEQKPNILAALSDGRRSSSDLNGQIQTENIVYNISSSNELKAQLSEKNSSLVIPEVPVTIKVEPVEDSCVMDATKLTPKSHTEQIRQAGMTRSSSVDQLMAQSRELSKPSILRSQSVGGESNVSLSASHRRPSISENPSPSDAALTTPAPSDAALTTPAPSDVALTTTATETATSASESGTITANVDSYSAAEINSILNLGTLTPEQHDFLTQVTKFLEQLSVLGCSSMKVPLKHDKISTDNKKFTSFGYFSFKHLTDKSMIRCIECKECSDILSPREFIVHLCGSVRHMQFEMDKLLRTTFEFCISHVDSSVSDKCARALLIMIFKLERSIYRSCQESCQTALSPTAETSMPVSPLTAPSSTKNLSAPETPSSPMTVEKEQPSFGGASSLVNFLTPDPPPTTTQSTSSAPSTPQGNSLPTIHAIDETISASLALGEYLSNIQGVGGTQPRKGIDGAVVTTALSQGTGQHSSTTQVSGQPLPHDGPKSVAPSSVGIGQPLTAPTNSYRSPEMEQMLQCMHQSSSLKRNSRQSFTNVDNLLPGSTLPRARRLSKNGMEDQRSQYGQSRVENPETFSQVSFPESRVYKPSADQTYQGSGARDRTRRGHQLEALILPETGIPSQSWPGSNVMPSTCSRTSFYQGGQLSSMSSVHSRTLENVNPENLHASNPFQTGSYSAGQMPNHSSGRYQANNTSARLTTGEPQGISRHAGYMRPQLNNGPNTSTIPFGPSGNFGSFNRMGAQTSIPFQGSVNNMGSHGILGPQCNNTTALPGNFSHTGTTGQFRNAVGPHGIVGPQNTLPPNMLGPQCSNISGPQSTLGPNSSLPQSMLGPQPSNTIGPQSTLDPHCTSSTTQRTSGVNSASGPQQPSSGAQSNEAINSSENHDRFSPSVQDRFWVSLGDKIQSEADAHQMFVMGQMMQRKAVEWFRDTLQQTRVTMEKMDKEHKEEIRKRKESEEQVKNRFIMFKSLVETYTKKPS
ncbi:uncharacterized protein LOC110448581 [Mizuhopecten yessoensis]|uniref:uncharacterized protein LOC110448581 n=1 Tax=Mizuhopecten yessoensis TaxID=6573 RepID=UPI000B45CCD2|nr:uncharacterized protein LOC110448581 [Mizuhopecten yessoensis]XP_021350573.1 uncharacterized protein LOC110448581 [Mizuhopecten yessoensis]